MKRQGAVSVCIAGLLLAAYAEPVDTVQTTEVVEASDEGSGEAVIPTECPEVDTVGRTVLLAHESDCTKFYACSNGRKIVMQCALMDGNGNRLYFNVKTQMCDWPKSSGCTNKNSTGEPAGGNTTHAPTEGPTTSEEPTDKSTTPGDSGEAVIATECPQVDPAGNTVLLAHESDCTKFYACSNGRKILMQCALMDSHGNRLYFNVKTQMCDWPRDSGCTNKNMTDGSVGGNMTSTERPITTEDDARQPTTDGILSSTAQSTIPKDSTNEPTTEGPTRPFSEWPTTGNPTDEPITESTTLSPSEEPTTSEHEGATDPSTESPITSENPTYKPTTDGTSHSSSEWPTTTEHELTTEGTTDPLTEGPTSGNPTEKPTTEVTTHAGSEEPITTESPTSKPTTEVATHHTELPTTPDDTQNTEGTKNPGTDLPITTEDPTQKPTTEDATHPSSESSTTPGYEPTTEGSTHSETESPETTVEPTHQPTIDDTTHSSTELSTTTDDKSTTESTTPPSTEWPETPENSTGEPTTEGSTHSETEFPETTVKPTYQPLPTTADHESTTEGTTRPSTSWPETTENPTEEPTTDGTTPPYTEEPTTAENLITEVPTQPTTERPITTEGSTHKPSTTPTPQTTTAVIPTKPPDFMNPDVSDLCPANGTKNKVSYPHECICEKYYICSEAGLVLHQCLNHTHFNPKINACDKPENAGCSTLPVTQPPPTTPTIPTDCPESDPAIPVQLAHPTNCSLYYRCVERERVLKSCSTGLHFNPQIQLCDWPESAGCTAKEETTPTHPVTSPIPKPSECPADSNRTLIPHETTCSMFYICDKGQKKLASCVPGLEFNPVLRACDSPVAFGCSTSSRSVNSQFIVMSDDSNARISDESNARSRESRELRHHSSHNHESNDDSRECIGQCPQRNPTEAVLLQHRDCNKFCKCHDGKAHVLKCPSKTHYNPVEQICDYPQNAGCRG